MEEGKCAFKILIGKPPGKRPFGRLKPRWKGNFRMDPKEICVSMRTWIDSAQDGDYWRALVNAVLSLRVP